MIELGKRCFRCMEEILESSKICPFCGYDDESFIESSNSTERSILKARYLLGCICVTGEYYRRYFAFDYVRNCKVLIDELYPSHYVNNMFSQGTFYFEDRAKPWVDNAVNTALDAVSRLRSANEIKGCSDFVDAFAENGTLYTVFEWVQGTSIARMDFAKLSKDSIHSIVRQIGSTLSEYHNKGLAYGYLCPENIWVTSSGEVVLLGTGIPVVEFMRSENDNDKGDLIHSFAAPECVDSGFLFWDARADIYSFAAFIIWCFEGKVPKTGSKDAFSGKNIKYQFNSNEIKALTLALSFLPYKRQTSIHSFYEQYTGENTVDDDSNGRTSVYKYWAIIMAGILLIILGINLLFSFTPRQNKIKDETDFSFVEEVRTELVTEFTWHESVTLMEC